MAYDKTLLLNQAKEIIKDKEVIFIDELISFMPCSMSTFYELFPASSEEMESLKQLINLNKVNTKALLRKNWKEAEAPALQIALYKLCGTDDENHKLNGSKQEVKQEAKVEGAILNW